MFPRWLSWLVLIMLSYLVVVGNRASHEALPTATPTQEAVATPAAPEQEGITITPALAEAADMERWKRAINPDYAARTQCEFTVKPSEATRLVWKVTDDKSGAGAAAKCGETITLKLTVWNARGLAAHSSEVAFALGAREVAAGLDAALVGIRVGGIRTVILSPEAMRRDKKTTAPKALLNAIGNGHVVIVTAERK